MHITFTIPKILRAYFKRNRKLLKLLVQSANFTMNTYFKESLGIDDGYSGGIYCVQTQGSLFNFHPHVHALVLGGILRDGVFTAEIFPSSQLIAQIFRARLLKVLVKEGIITEELVKMLLSWNHNSGFNVHISGRKIMGENETRIEQISRYMSRAAISVERVEFDPCEQTVTVFEKKDQGHSEMRTNSVKTYPVLEFLALLACHIPSTYESLVYYYGVYSSSYWGKEKKMADSIGEVVQEQGKTPRKASSTWARLIKKVFEIDPLQCPFLDEMR